MTASLGARALIDLVLDDGSWTSWDTPPDRSGISDGYGEWLRGQDPDELRRVRPDRFAAVSHGTL